jgi:hypothetical protein
MAEVADVGDRPAEGGAAKPEKSQEDVSGALRWSGRNLGGHVLVAIIACMDSCSRARLACALAAVLVAFDAGAQSEVQALKAEIESLRRQLPDQAHAMTDVDYHFSNLWFAAQKENWPLAEFYLNETRSHLNWAVRLRPVRRLSSGAELDVAAILKGIEQGALGELRNAVSRKDAETFNTAYRSMLNSCHGCHVAAEKPYLKPHVPEAPASRMIDFSPAVTR